MAYSGSVAMPKIVYNSVTLYLPYRPIQYDTAITGDKVITPGPTYTQIVAYSPLVEVEMKGHPFTDSTDDWDGTGAKLWTVAFDTFYTTWAGLGKVFSFYRVGNGSTSDRRLYLQYCVWTGDDDGLRILAGYNRYEQVIKLRQEGAAR